MNKVAAFALRRKNSILSMSEKMFCPPQPLRFWITPAYAGKRGSGSLPRSCRRDHPRVCGKKVTVIRSQTINEGSPPRVRGKGTLRELKRFSSGITPACAGKSRRFFVFVWFKEDHPRVCGEKWRIRWKNTQTTGSPPRMRGKAMPRLFLFPFWRITPAYAGKRKRTGRRRNH